MFYNMQIKLTRRFDDNRRSIGSYTMSLAIANVSSLLFAVLNHLVSSHVYFNARWPTFLVGSAAFCVIYRFLINIDRWKRARTSILNYRAARDVCSSSAYSISEESAAFWQMFRRRNAANRRLRVAFVAVLHTRLTSVQFAFANGRIDSDERAADHRTRAARRIRARARHRDGFARACICRERACPLFFLSFLFFPFLSFFFFFFFFFNVTTDWRSCRCDRSCSPASLPFRCAGLCISRFIACSVASAPSSSPSPFPRPRSPMYSRSSLIAQVASDVRTSWRRKWSSGGNMGNQVTSGLPGCCSMFC